MLRSVALKMLHDQWRILAVWSVLAAILAAFYLSLYPSIGSVDEMRRLLDAMPPELRAMFSIEGADLGTPAGYLNMELFTFMLPLIVAAVTVTAGSGATAGEEERGTLELLLANPIGRWRIVVEKALGGALLAGHAARRHRARPRGRNRPARRRSRRTASDAHRCGSPRCSSGPGG